MTKTIKLLIIAWFGLLASTAMHAEQKMTVEELKVLQAVEKMTSSLQSADIDAVISTYEEKPSVAFERGSYISDINAIRAIFSEMSALDVDVTYTGHEVIVAGDVAIHFAPWSMKGILPDGNEFADRGLSVAVLRRQENGEWLIAIDQPYGDHLLNN